MKININVKRTFKINGKEYNSVEEMPDDIRATFAKATASPSASEHHTSSDTMRTKIIFNGQEYDSIDSMPQDMRQLYEKVLKAAETGTAPSDIDLTGISNGILRETSTPETVHAGVVHQSPKFESSFSLRNVIVVVMLAALFLVVYYLAYHK